MTLDHAPLTIALAMLVGVVAQAAARHARVPGIVLLLALGVALGPDGADLVRPHTMGEGLQAFVGFAVAIILFEGALNIRFSALRRQALSIRRLVTVGAVITGVLATLAAWLVMPWDWRPAVLFGTLVMVTGPTVVNPLVRRLRLAPHLSGILVAEGIFVDALGATVAVVALEIVLADSSGAAALEAASIVVRFGTGMLVGGIAGLVLVGLLRVRRLVPTGLESVLALAVAVASFQVSDAIVSESGLIASIVGGLIVGNVPTRRLAEIAEFKEQLTDLLVATLFVLLTADVRLSEILDLGWRGLAVVGLLVAIVRPTMVFASTFRTELTRGDKLCLSWIAPRGIVAAAVASLFAAELARAEIAGGADLRALVFVVIATTVTVQGLTAGIVADRLGVRLPRRSGAMILGANPLARLVARLLRDAGERVVLVESREQLCDQARAEGLEVVRGDGLDPDVLSEAGIATVAHCVGMTPNESVNFLFARRVAEELRGPTLAVLLERHDAGVSPKMADDHDVEVLFAAETNVLHWLDVIRRDGALIQHWRLERAEERPVLAELLHVDVLPVVLRRGPEVSLVTSESQARAGDELALAIVADQVELATAWLNARGWRLVEG